MSHAMIGYVRIAFVLLAGCQAIFPLTEPPKDGPPPIDAGPFVDSDPASCWDLSQRDHDADGDRLVDGCDNCPLVANGPNDSDNQTDTDIDGVGDACDPDVAHPSERLAFFDPMLDINPADWDRLGAWAADSVGVVQNDASGSALLIGKTAYTNPVIQARVIEIGGTTANREAGVYVVTQSGASMDPTDGVSCTQIIDATNKHFMQVRRKANNTVLFAMPSGALVEGAFEIENRSNRSKNTTPAQFTGPECSASLLDGSGATTVSDNNPSIPVTGRPAFYTFKANATFGPILVIETTPAQ